jgi:hypothetical protein
LKRKRVETLKSLKVESWKLTVENRKKKCQQFFNRPRKAGERPIIPLCLNLPQPRKVNLRKTFEFGVF